MYFNISVCCMSSENMIYLRQRFDELLDIGDTLTAKNVR